MERIRAEEQKIQQELTPEQNLELLDDLMSFKKSRVDHLVELTRENGDDMTADHIVDLWRLYEEQQEHDIKQSELGTEIYKHKIELFDQREQRKEQFM